MAYQHAEIVSLEAGINDNSFATRAERNDRIACKMGKQRLLVLYSSLAKLLIDSSYTWRAREPVGALETVLNSPDMEGGVGGAVMMCAGSQGTGGGKGEKRKERSSGQKSDNGGKGGFGNENGA